MPRKTHPKRQPKRHRREHAMKATATIAVRSLGRFHGKEAFATEEIADEALAQARAYKISRGVDPETGHIERRVYGCPDCGHFHLTALAEWEDRTEGARP